MPLRSIPFMILTFQERRYKSDSTAEMVATICAWSVAEFAAAATGVDIIESDCKALEDCGRGLIVEINQERSRQHYLNMATKW